jgi:hypothetical protein
MWLILWLGVGFVLIYINQETKTYYVLDRKTETSSLEMFAVT